MGNKKTRQTCNRLHRRMAGRWGCGLSLLRCGQVVHHVIFVTHRNAGIGFCQATPPSCVDAPCDAFIIGNTSLAQSFASTRCFNLDHSWKLISPMPTLVLSRARPPWISFLQLFLCHIGIILYLCGEIAQEQNNTKHKSRKPGWYEKKFNVTGSCNSKNKQEAELQWLEWNGKRIFEVIVWANVKHEL